MIKEEVNKKRQNSENRAIFIEQYLKKSNARGFQE